MQHPLGPTVQSPSLIWEETKVSEITIIYAKLRISGFRVFYSFAFFLRENPGGGGGGYSFLGNSFFVSKFDGEIAVSNMGRKNILLYHFVP